MKTKRLVHTAPLLLGMLLLFACVPVTDNQHHEYDPYEDVEIPPIPDEIFSVRDAVVKYLFYTHSFWVVPWSTSEWQIVDRPKIYRRFGPIYGSAGYEFLIEDINVRIVSPAVGRDGMKYGIDVKKGQNFLWEGGMDFKGQFRELAVRFK